MKHVLTLYFDQPLPISNYCEQKRVAKTNIYKSSFANELLYIWMIKPYRMVEYQPYNERDDFS